MENDQDYSMKQLDLFGNCEPEDAGYALHWQKMLGVSCPQTMALHLQGASESYSTAGLVRSDSEFWTANISEWPKDGSACSLSQILEANPATKYSLSPKACQGILRRAEKRGKELPEMLERALQRVASEGTSKDAEPCEAKAEI
jgi:hypothetical protein